MSNIIQFPKTPNNTKEALLARALRLHNNLIVNILDVVEFAPNTLDYILDLYDTTNDLLNSLEESNDN